MAFDNAIESPKIEAINTQDQSNWTSIEIAKEKGNPRFISAATNGYTYSGLELFNENKESLLKINPTENDSQWTPQLEIGADEHILGFSCSTIEDIINLTILLAKIGEVK